MCFGSGEYVDLAPVHVADCASIVVIFVYCIVFLGLYLFY